MRDPTQMNLPRSLPRPDLDEAITVCELRRETVYRRLLALEGEDRVLRPAEQGAKRDVLELAIAHNPLAAAVFYRKPLQCAHALLADLPFLGRPVTSFAVHEVLRRTRFHRDFADGGSPGVLMLGEDRVTHDQLLEWLQELIPNVNLGRVYDRSWLLEKPVVAPVLAGVVTGFLLATDAEPGQGLHALGAGALGAGACGLVLYGLNRTRYGRRLTKTAPWNSTLYVDVNLALLRDYPDELALGSRAFVPRPQLGLWKTKARYYPFARQVSEGDYLAALRERRAAQKAAA